MGKNMEQKEIVKELEKLAEDMILQRKFQKNLKEVFVNKCMKFIDNEETEQERKKLLEIIKKVSWFSFVDINMFFQVSICNLLKEIDDDAYFLYENRRPESSNHQIISSLSLNCGIAKDQYIYYIKQHGKIIIKEKRKITNKTIFIVDDYSGSGSTIENLIKEIEKNYFQNDVYIIVYIWQKTAYEKISKFLKEQTKNNYHIYKDDEMIEEMDYKEKCKKQKEIQKMIETICQGCPDEEERFGYKNTGAMISINGVSPNNNISMLWRRNIIYHEMNWSNLLDRDFCWEVLDNKKKKLVSKSFKVNEIYETEKYINSNLTKKDLELLIYLFNEYSINVEQLRKIMGYDNTTQIEEQLKELEEKNIITITKDYRFVCFKDNQIIKILRRIDRHIAERAVGKKENRNITKK